VELLPFENNPSRLAAELHLSVENVREILSLYDDLADVSSAERQTVSNKVIPLRVKQRS
jgi:hypothetical protein